MSHPTFSLQNILNEPLSPDLCKRILEEIKSPLMEQSFQMTNDESFSNSFVNAPKRPNIPPPSFNSKQVRPPAIKQKPNTYSYGQSFRDDLGYNSYNQNMYAGHTTKTQFLQGLTPRYQSQYIMPQTDNYIPNQSRVQIESVVSPLDPNITQKKPQSQDFIDDIWGHLCGNVQNYQEEQEIYYNEKKSKWQRKKIFDSKGLSVLQNTKPRKYTNNQVESILLVNEQQKASHISIQGTVQNPAQQKSEEDVLEQLRRNRHFEMAFFVGFVLSLMKKLECAQKQRRFLQDNIEVVFQLAGSENVSFRSLVLDSNQNCDKFFARMNCASICEMIKKISRNKLLNKNNADIKQYNKQKNQVADSLENMLHTFAQIQGCIEQFINEHDSINKLQTVYAVLNDKFTSTTTKNTHEQIVNLLRDLRLFKYEAKACHLEYVWGNFMTDLLSESQFINGISKTNGMYRQSFARDQDQFGSELSKMGYVKN